LAKHVAGVHQRRYVLGVAQRRDRRVSGVDRVQHGPFPVRVLVDDGEEYLGQMVTVRVAHVRAQDLVPTFAFEARLKSDEARNNNAGELSDAGKSNAVIKIKSPSTQSFRKRLKEKFKYVFKKKKI